MSPHFGSPEVPPLEWTGRAELEREEVGPPTQG